MATSQLTLTPLRLASRTSATPAAEDRRARQADAGFLRQMERGGDGDRFGADRNSGKSQARSDLAVVGDAVARQIVILRPEADRVIERSPRTASRAAGSWCRRRCLACERRWRRRVSDWSFRRASPPNCWVSAPIGKTRASPSGSRCAAPGARPAPAQVRAAAWCRADRPPP